MTTEATFPLIEEPPVAPPIVGVGAVFLAPVDERAGTGVGLLSPFRRDKRNDFVSGTGSSLLGSKILQVLGTNADNGRMTAELPWRSDFGSLVYTLKFAAIDDTMAALVRSRVSKALARWLPEVKVLAVGLKRYINAFGDVAGLATISYDVVQVGTNNLLAKNQAVEIPVGA